MDLLDFRHELDALDDQLVELFRRRMEISSQIAAYKKEKGLPILDAGREREKTRALCDQMPPELRSYTAVLYSSLFELSRSCQRRQMAQFTELNQTIDDAICHTPKLFPQEANVAICGVEGAFAQLACEKLFRIPLMMEFSNFDAVFSAINQGLCQYGIVPIENSTTGSVKKIHDLLSTYGFFVVRSVRVKADYNLLAKPVTNLADIQEIFTHEQAMGQCAEFIRSLGSAVKVTLCDNTVLAAQAVAKSSRQDVAAICSRTCVDLFDLRCLKRNVQDWDSNNTQFVCVSKALEIYPGADRTSIMLSLPNQPGALYKLLARFYAQGINITRLESRNIPGRDFEIRFCLELETSIYAQEFIQIICDLSADCEEFTYFGSYSEVV